MYMIFHCVRTFAFFDRLGRRYCDSGKLIGDWRSFLDLFAYWIAIGLSFLHLIKYAFRNASFWFSVAKGVQESQRRGRGPKNEMFHIYEQM